MMISEAEIVVKDLHKEFILPQNRHTSLKQVFVNVGRKNIKKRQKVLDGISFEVNKGDFFGIVGRNGSGKSTLLKILAGVYSPTSGIVDVMGKLTPFIELGVGFNPELTGRDNVYLNGALLGFSHKEMDAIYDEIVDFAELSEFMDQKLKNYSSGMQVRLAFSIAIKARNEILIFDEVLAVGDEAFQRKCLDVFERYKASGQTVVLVTHDMETVRQFCNRAMLIHQGKIVEIGNPRRVAQIYSDLNQEAIDKGVEMANQKTATQFLKAAIMSQDRRPRQSFNVGETLVARVSWNGLDVSKVESLGVNVFKKSGEHVTGLNTRFDKSINGWTQDGMIELELVLNMTAGKYYLLIEAFESEGQVIDSILDGPQFSIRRSTSLEWSGLVDLPHAWVRKVRDEA